MVAGRPVQEDHRQGEQEERDEADRGGVAGERVGADEFHAVGEQPQRRRHVQRPVGPAVRVRRTDPQHRHEGDERPESEPRRQGPAQYAG